MPVRPGSRVQILCSCGKIGVIEWTGEKYRAVTEGWRFHSNPDNEDETRLWHCGEAGHYQRALGPPPEDGFFEYDAGPPA